MNLRDKIFLTFFTIFFITACVSFFGAVMTFSLKTALTYLVVFAISVILMICLVELYIRTVNLKRSGDNEIKAY